MASKPTPEQWRTALLAAMTEAGITSAKEQAMLLGQIDHESAGFTRFEEGFNYRVDRLLAISLTARKRGREAVEAAIKAGPEAVANMMYMGRMGNVQPGDGWRFRGRGPIQLTGRDNYTACGKAIGVDIVSNPDLVLRPDIGAKTVIWFWKTRVGSKGATGDILTVTKIINGGTIGLDHRKERYAFYLAMLNAREDGGMLA